MTAKSSDKNLGKVIAGRYRLETRIGEGGMGVVYRARHVLIDRVVALKLIRPDLRGETHLRAWMLREARAANRVDHAHIVDIHDIGETDEGELYLVMEYLVGISLSSEIARGPFPVVRAVDILEQMCAALARAHDLGVVHRDLKSDNIMLTVKGGEERLGQDIGFWFGGIGARSEACSQGRGIRHPGIYVAGASARRGSGTQVGSICAWGPFFRDVHRPASIQVAGSGHAFGDAAKRPRASSEQIASGPAPCRRIDHAAFARKRSS